MTLDHIKYITFSQLMASVESDLDKYADSGMVDRSKYIKTVRKVNSDLGIRINKEKEVMLPIKNHRVILPEDFEYLQVALLCKETPVKCYVTPSVDAPKLVPCSTTETVDVTPCNSCPSTCTEGTTTSCGSCYKIYKYESQDLTIVYNNAVPVKLTKKTSRYCSPNCLNTMLVSDKYKYTIDIQENILTISGVKEGEIYLNYLTDMVDESGELLIVDHPLINDYYEYSVKEKILENFLLNSDDDVVNKLKYTTEQKRLARIDAMNFVYMPEYTEIVQYQNAKRQNFYNRYLKMFERY